MSAFIPLLIGTLMGMLAYQLMQRPRVPLDRYFGMAFLFSALCWIFGPFDRFLGALFTLAALVTAAITTIVSIVGTNRRTRPRIEP